MRREVIGLIAHVDAGKTTLAEALLYETGAIRRQGRVDARDCFLDFDPIERERKITVFAKPAAIEVADCSFTLLDAPGHVDFSAEAERTLAVLDLAVMVIDANDTVTGHARTLWRLLSRYQVPTLVFINKCDLDTADPQATLGLIQARLDEGCFELGRLHEDDVQERLATLDEEALDELLDGGVLSVDTVRRLVWECKAFPCVFGSALRSEGITELLDALVSFSRERTWPKSFGARIFKVTHDERGERLCWAKVTGGRLHAKETVRVTDAAQESWQEKVDTLRLSSGPRMRVVPEAEAGELVAISGLSRASVGDGLGEEPPRGAPVLSPVLDYAVSSDDCDAHALYAALEVLTQEDPLLLASFDETSGEVRVRCMGIIQTEVVCEQLRSRFGIEALLGAPTIVYKETIAESVAGVGHFEPLRHYAEVHLLLEPLPRGTGMRYESRVSTDDLELRWQRLILTHAAEREHKGVLTGSGLDDVRICLVAGRAHPKHTEGGDFRQATYRAIRQALMRADSVLLEPMYAFELEVPAERLGRALTDLHAMGAKSEAPVTDGEVARITGVAPVARIAGYSNEVSSYTRGDGHLFLEPCGFDVCQDAQQVIEERGYQPESDLANTPDSVFCSHGAGFVVKWNEVEEHAHIRV